MKRVLRESKFKVTLTTSQGQTIEQVKDAPNQSVAIQRVMGMLPAGTQFLTTTAAALDPETPPGQAPVMPQMQLPRQPVGMQPLRQLMVPGQQQQSQQESFERRLRYPYSISLPMQFSRMLNETSPVRVIEKNGQHHIVLTNAADMRDFLDRLGTHRDREAAKIILNGIRSSIPV